MKEKKEAIALIDRFKTLALSSGVLEEDLCIEDLRNCALLTANKVVEQWEYIDAHISDLGGELNPNLKYWYNVITELENFKI